MPSVETNSQLRQVLSWDVRALDAVGVHVKMSDSAMIDAALDVRITGQSTKSRIALSSVGWSTTGAYIDSISGAFPAIAANGEGNILLDTSTIDHVDLYVATLGNSRIFVNSEEGNMSNFTLYEGDAGVTKIAGVDNPLPVANYQLNPVITPTVASSAQSLQQFGGDGTLLLRYLRATVNADDDVIAGERLANGFPDCFLLWPESTFEIRADEPITVVDIVAFGSAQSSSPSPGEVALDGSTTAAVIRGSLKRKFEFSSADNVRHVMISISPKFTPASGPETVQVLVEGRSF